MCVEIENVEREEDGVITLGTVYTERRLVVDPLTIWRNRYSLQEYLAIKLKKIQVFVYRPFLSGKSSLRNNNTFFSDLFS